MGWKVKTFWTLAAGGFAYVIAIVSLTIPVLQRNATYVHKLNPTYWQDLSNVEQFGFHRGQIQAFTVQSTDNVTLYGWHLLPTHLYRKHKAELRDHSHAKVPSYDEARSMPGPRLMHADPQARVVVSFHGNAGHLASSYRPSTYQQFLSLSTPEQPVHVIAFDYRGFGLSTGSPTEAGLRDDSLAIMSAVAERTDQGQQSSNIAKLKPSQIILVGQSLGTFVSTAIFYDWTIKLQQAPFRALVLLASFTSLPKLLESYSIKGLTPPVLSPLTQYPWAQRWLISKVRDKWNTAERLEELVQRPDLKLNLAILHAGDDWEIPWREGMRNWHRIAQAVNGTGVLDTAADVFASETAHSWTSDDGLKRVTWDKIRHGGHNRIPVSEQVKSVLYDVLESE